MPQRTSGQRPESAGLVAGTSTADVPTAGRERFGELDKLTIRELLRVGAAYFVNGPDAKQACRQVQSVLAKLSLCRTHVMGGRKYVCEDCDSESSRYNSCGDRHCPQCSGSKRFDFNEKASKRLLPGVVYYQVVFTLPSELSELALANRAEMADLLVGSAWKSLAKNIKTEQGYDPAAITVLHTWNQRLEAHWHVHMLVPGEGPAEGPAGPRRNIKESPGINTDRWQKAEAPPESRNSDGYYLVDADRLRDGYRKRAIAKLRRLRAAGKLKFGGKFEYLRSDENWEVFLKNLQSMTWVAYIQPPPKETSSASEVVNYLTRYLTGGPISDARITAANRKEVTFMAREGKRVGGEREQVPITLPIAEFVRRWCLHVQPEQLTKTRYFGGFSNTRLAQYMSRCLEQLATTEHSSQPESALASASESEPEPERRVAECLHCGSDRLKLVSESAKPSWKELLWRESDTCPFWYADTQRAEHRRYWTAAYGSGFYDWYLETQIESAKESAPRASPPIQLYLPGIAPRKSFELESF